MFNLLENMPKDVLMQQLTDGLILMVLGMVTVFIFLTILIFTTKLLSKVLGKIAPEKPAAAAPKRSTAPAATAAPVTKDAEVAAAIAAAYQRSRN